MADSKEPFTNENAEIPKLDKEKESKNTKTCLITLLILFVLSIIISIILTTTIKSNDKDDKKEKNSSIIKTKYQSYKDNEKIFLFNSSYLKYISSIKINGTDSQLSNHQFFETIGVYEIEFEINSSLEYLDEMFLDCENLIEINFSLLKNIKPSSMVRTFSGCKSLTSVNLSKFDLSNLQ